MIWVAIFKAEIHAGGADMEQEIAGRRRCVMHAANLAEGVQLFRFRHSEQAVPGRRPDPHDARQSTVERAKSDAPDQRGEIAAQAPHRFLGGYSRVQRHDQKNCGAGQPGIDSLRDD
jgi:hypothetical protein